MEEVIGSMDERDESGHENGHENGQYENSGMQIVVQGRIKDRGPNKSEIITFVIPLDKVDPKTRKLVCIVNIPEEGRERAPVYIKQTDK